jgi:hypothetical protein
LPAGSAIQRIVTELDHRVPAANVRTLDSLVDDATVRVRLTMLLIAVAGASALLLGVVGVYSVVSYRVNEHRRIHRWGDGAARGGHVGRDTLAGAASGENSTSGRAARRIE